MHGVYIPGVTLCRYFSCSNNVRHLLRKTVSFSCTMEFLLFLVERGHYYTKSNKCRCSLYQFSSSPLEQFYFFWLLIEDFFFPLSPFIFFASDVRLSSSYCSKLKFYINACIAHITCSFPFSFIWKARHHANVIAALIGYRCWYLVANGKFMTLKSYEPGLTGKSSDQGSQT